MTRLVTLRRRAEFLAVRGGSRWSTPSFLMEARANPGNPPGAGPRFGFTVTKKLGPAVTRNRIRRRLREALRTGALTSAKPGLDYVVIARHAAATRPFADLQSDFRIAIERVSRPVRRPRPARTADA